MVWYQESKHRKRNGFSPSWKADDADNELACPLDLPDVRVLASRVLENATVLIEVESTLHTALYYCCGREIDQFHEFDRPIRLRHLPVFGRAVLIEIRPKRYRCPYREGDRPAALQATTLGLNPILLHLVVSMGDLIEPLKIRAGT